MPPLYPKVKPNPLQKANLCSRLFFWWLNPLFKIGYKRKLENDDMYPVLPEDRSQHLGEELQGYWDQEVLRTQEDAREPSLMKVIIKSYGKSYLVLGMLTCLERTRPHVQGQGQRPRVPGCDREGAAEKSYPMHEARGGSWEEQPDVKGAVAAQAQECLEELLHVQDENVPDFMEGEAVGAACERVCVHACVHVCRTRQEC